jgi:hypothetical protein
MTSPSMGSVLTPEVFDPSIDTATLPDTVATYPADVAPEVVTPVLMVDTIHANVHNVPANTEKVAGYVSGTPDIRWVAADWDRFSHVKVRINQSPSAGALEGDVLDSEAGAWTIQEIVTAVEARNRAKLHTTVYISASSVTPLVNALANAKLTGVSLWVADWNLSLAEASAKLTNTGPYPVVAYQWASPSSNPSTRLPGSNLTLSEANCDLSVTVASWPAVVAPVTPPPVVHRSGLVVLADFSSLKVTSTDGVTWKKAA